MLGVNPSGSLQVFGREITFEIAYSYLRDHEFTMPERYRHADRQTDDLVWHKRALYSIAR